MLHTLSGSLALAHDDALCMSKHAASGPLYLQQPSLGIIELIEVPPPPRPQHSLPASSFMSSSYASSSSSSSSSDETADETACSSYCSSDPEEEVSRVSVPDDTYKTRLHRVLVWREKLVKALGAPSAAPPPTPSPQLKRKADDEEPESDDDTVSVTACAYVPRESFSPYVAQASHSSKRSRSSASRSHARWPQRTASVHSCPACDASFTTRQSLQQHASEPSPNDACRAAVEYDFEG
ncbi:uncharacterized protein B0H18DRAFT_983735 [Fomitopsis serialis]|uniref:uncharacterized protein n=1 Tax=Fomitopsis serialis TaxID=139415 RepID=UPI002008DBDE|nr:uncharacterized protein B0H18DRAFT_983735 [Neoantrodia serialis]KAH9933445.1 hypothetical protein B0H18DRAFT_983735 [Neoantrodia serialis]